PGKGTIFKIYLPKTTTTKGSVEKARSTVGDSRGTETVLVVEDEAAVLKLVVRVLERKGYQVLQARDGLEGQTVANTHAGPIHLLLTDVVMPKSSGKALAEKLLATRPELKVLYMSGYTDNAIVHHGVLDKGTPFVQKPFSANLLTRKIREVLNT
ncbi:MAG: response regulator, partial [Deltaproteobacteria bacterium]|nr:response regulator [Deltaproteobacteria bacterium]